MSHFSHRNLSPNLLSFLIGSSPRLAIGVHRNDPIGLEEPALGIVIRGIPRSAMGDLVGPVAIKRLRGHCQSRRNTLNLSRRDGWGCARLGCCDLRRQR